MCPDHKGIFSSLPCAVCHSCFVLCLQTWAAPFCRAVSLDAPALPEILEAQLRFLTCAGNAKRCRSKREGGEGAAEVMKDFRKRRCNRLKGLRHHFCCASPVPQEIILLPQKHLTMKRWRGNKRRSFLVVRDLGG